MDINAPITLDVAQSYLDAQGNLHLTSGVQLRQGERQLRAQEMHGDSLGNWTVPGEVELSDPSLIVRGHGAQAATQTGTVEISDTSFELPARYGHGSASFIRLSQEGQVELKGVRYTTCPGPEPDWELKAGALKIDGNASTGTARDVQLFFKGVSIFPIPFVPVAFPYFTFPVGNERKSGVLVPTLGMSTNSGHALSVPVYWNIAPNYDATIVPTWYTERGIDLGTEFRFLTRKTHGEINANYLVDDKKTGEDRSYVELHSQTDFSSQLRLDLDGSNVSDIDWLEDLGTAAQRTGVIVLPRAARATYRGDEWSLVALAQNFQTVDPEITADQRPYTLLPQLSFNGWFPNRLFGLSMGIAGEYSNFQATSGSTALEGQRVDVMPELRLPLRHKGMFVEPSAAWRYTAYQLDPDTAPTDPGLADESPTRAAPILSLDSGVVFERPSGRTQQRIQTLEPRVLYLYVPYRQQDSLPVFDTKQPDFNLIQLFSTNRYVGPDRLGDANQIAMGVTTRLLDSNSGTQYLMATLGEVYRFSTPRVSLPGEAVSTQSSSDIIGELRLGGYKNWNAGIGLQWDPNSQQLQRTEVNAQYIPGGGRVMNVGYVYRRVTFTQTSAVEQPGLEQVFASAAWPVGKRINLFGRYTYSLEDRQTIDTLAGLEYRDCCWGFRFGMGQSRNQNGELEVSWKWQVELNGLTKGNVGSASDTILSQAIPGYSASRIDRRSVP